MKLICVIIDAFGIGQMDDVPEVRRSDIGANTLLHVAQMYEGFSLPLLESFGLGNLVGVQEIRPVGSESLASYGRLRLAYKGADTFMGHQELMGTLPITPPSRYMSDLAPTVKVYLQQKGHIVANVMDELSPLLIDGVAVVADCMEADPGLSINITASLNEINIDDLLVIAGQVRDVVPVSRVIAIGSKEFTLNDIKNAIIHKGDHAVGVNTTSLCLLDEKVILRHFGYKINLEGQAPTRVFAKGHPVFLIGKAADVIQCKGATSIPEVDTRKVFELIKEKIVLCDNCLIIANIQETDLSGHEKDLERWARLLMTIDKELKNLLPLIGYDDVLIITGDHGNDPIVGHGQHTREMTPLLFYSPQYCSKDLGLRRGLFDVGATISDFFGAGTTEGGKSFLTELARR
jgi:phosphopentomutase